MLIKTFNVKNWSIQQEILKRVQKESEVEWSRTQLEPAPIPRYVKPKVEENKLEWRIFFKAMNKLRP